MSSYPLTTYISQITSWESSFTTILPQSHKFHLGQIEEYPLFVQVGIGDPTLSNSSSSVIFVIFPLKIPVTLVTLTRQSTLLLKYVQYEDDFLPKKLFKWSKKNWYFLIDLCNKNI